jgi:hypothetical protein
MASASLDSIYLGRCGTFTTREIRWSSHSLTAARCVRSSGAVNAHNTRNDPIPHQIRLKGGEDTAYGWRGKGSTGHMLTKGNGLPLACLVTTANASEVTVGPKAVDRARFP